MSIERRRPLRCWWHCTVSEDRCRFRSRHRSLEGCMPRRQSTCHRRLAEPPRNGTVAYWRSLVLRSVAMCGGRPPGGRFLHFVYGGTGAHM